MRESKVWKENGINGRHRDCCDKPWYGTWRAMISRCFREKDCDYARYGGRDITVCREWRDAAVFGRWAEAHPHEKGMSIDRIDVNGNYEPGNCRWANLREQANNRRNTVMLSYEGETHTLGEWSEIIGIDAQTVRKRYYRNNNPEKVLTRRLMRKRRTEIRKEAVI